MRRLIGIANVFMMISNDLFCKIEKAVQPKIPAALVYRTEFKNNSCIFCLTANVWKSILQIVKICDQNSSCTFHELSLKKEEKISKE